MVSAKLKAARKEWNAAARACVVAFCDAWLSHQLIAKGRVGSPNAPVEIIPPPRKGTRAYEQTIREFIRAMWPPDTPTPDPLFIGGEPIFDLRFRPPDA